MGILLGDPTDPPCHLSLATQKIRKVVKGWNSQIGVAVLHTKPGVAPNLPIFSCEGL